MKDVTYKRRNTTKNEIWDVYVVLAGVNLPTAEAIRTTATIIIFIIFTKQSNM